MCTTAKEICEHLEVYLVPLAFVSKNSPNILSIAITVSVAVNLWRRERSQPLVAKGTPQSFLMKSYEKRHVSYGVGTYPVRAALRRCHSIWANAF